MLDKGHIDIAGEKSEFDRAQFVECPALPATAAGDRFVPYGRDFFAQRRVRDFHQARKKLPDFFDSVGLFFRRHNVSRLEIPSPNQQIPRNLQASIFKTSRVVGVSGLLH